jgi:hypothetical protein
LHRLKTLLFRTAETVSRNSGQSRGYLWDYLSDIRSVFE